MKGIDIVVHGSIGHMSAFMAQSGHLVVLGDAGTHDAAAGTLSFSGLDDTGVQQDGITGDNAFGLSLTGQEAGSTVVLSAARRSSRAIFCANRLSSRALANPRMPCVGSWLSQKCLSTSYVEISSSR